jgi:hypothetical protein
MSDFTQSVLVDDSGRRRRALRRVGGAVSALLLIWLGVLSLAWLGIEPLGNLGFVDPWIGRVTPSALPARIQAAVAGGRVIAPGRSAAVVGIGNRTTPTGAHSDAVSGARRNAHHRSAPTSNAKPIHKHLHAPGSTQGHTGTTPSSTQAQEPVRSGTEPSQTAGSTNPGKSHSSPGQAKERATLPSSTGSPGTSTTSQGKSTTSPGHTKEPGQTSAQPAPSFNESVNANSKGIGAPPYKTTTPAP